VLSDCSLSGVIVHFVMLSDCGLSGVIVHFVMLSDCGLSGVIVHFVMLSDCGLSGVIVHFVSLSDCSLSGVIVHFVMLSDCGIAAAVPGGGGHVLDHVCHHRGPPACILLLQHSPRHTGGQCFYDSVFSWKIALVIDCQTC